MAPATLIAPALLTILGALALWLGFAGAISKWDWALRALGFALLLIAST